MRLKLFVSKYKKVTRRLSEWVEMLFKCRSSRPEVFFKKGVLRNFTKFTGDSGTGVFLWILWNF